MKKKLAYTPLKKKRLYEEVADQIKKKIFNGDLEPGDQLPSERELSEVFKVGRPTIREAMRTLSVLGLIESHPGFKGSIVKKIDFSQYLNEMSDLFTWMINLDKKSINEIRIARKFIELGIAHEVAKQATAKELESLDNYIAKMEKCTDDRIKYFKVATNFHFKLAELSKNRIFHIIWKLFYDVHWKEELQIERIYPYQIPDLLSANKKILEAIKSREPELIDKAMRFHASIESKLE